MPNKGPFVDESLSNFTLAAGEEVWYLIVNKVKTLL